MLLRRDPPPSEVLDRWRSGLPTPARLEALLPCGTLIRSGGPFGWTGPLGNPVRTGCVPTVPAGGLADACRLARSWNTFAGFPDRLVTSGELRGMHQAIFCLSASRRPGARAASAILHQINRCGVANATPIDAVHTAESAGADGVFAWGLSFIPEPGTGIPPAFVTGQTFREADARRLAACWNAARNVPLAVLDADAIGQAHDLLVLAACAVTRQDRISHRPPDVAMDAHILKAGAQILRSRLGSGEFVLGHGSRAAAEAVLHASPAPAVDGRLAGLETAHGLTEAA